MLQIASTRLEDVSITVVKSPKELEIKAGSVIKKIEREEEKKQVVNIAQTSKQMKKRRRETETESESEGEGEAINEEKKARAREANILFSVLLRLLPRWSTLKTISVVNAFGHSPRQTFASTLLNEVFQLLLSHPTIENLTVKGWAPDSVEDSVLGLAESTPSNLKYLFLPFNEANSGISWSTLRRIAIACPKLQSLQCRIKPLSPIPEYIVPNTEALFHGLRTLFVGNSLPNPPSNKPHLIARHLDILFPHLETITTFEHNVEAEPWIVVRELVKLCQASRMDERYRALAIQHLQSQPEANATRMITTGG